MLKTELRDLLNRDIEEHGNGEVGIADQLEPTWLRTITGGVFDRVREVFMLRAER